MLLSHGSPKAMTCNLQCQENGTGSEKKRVNYVVKSHKNGTGSGICLRVHSVSNESSMPGYAWKCVKNGAQTA